MSRPVPPPRLSAAQRIALALASATLQSEVRAAREEALTRHANALARPDDELARHIATKTLARYHAALGQLSMLYLDVAPMHYTGAAS